MIVRVQGAEQIAQQIYFEYDNQSVPLGKGGMGTVYQGRCVNMIDGSSIPVAIKFIASNSQELLMRAVQEASVQIAHNNLMRMYAFVANMEYDAYSQQSVTRYYLVMEYVDGIGLDAVLQGRTQTKSGQQISVASQFLSDYRADSLKATCEIMRPILTGVAEMHRQGFVHRDLDPSNVMITADGNVKVIDFGISKRMNALANPYGQKLTQSGTIMGKMDYASPEVVRGLTDMHNYTTDVYSLGVMMYQLIVGRMPFAGNQNEVMRAQVENPMPVQDIPNQAVAAIVARATEKEQSQRYPNAQAMLDDLMRVDFSRTTEPPVVDTARRVSEYRTNHSTPTDSEVVDIPVWMWVVGGLLGGAIGVVGALLLVL